MTDPDILPADLALERKVLGTVLRDNEAWNDCEADLDVADFRLRLHGDVFTALGTLISTGRSATLAATYRLLADRSPAYGSADCLQELERLYLSAGTPADIANGAMQLRRISVLRSLVLLGRKLAEDASAGTDTASVQNLIYSTERELALLTARTDTSGCVDVNQALDQALSRTEQAIRAAGISGVPTGLRRLDQQLGGLQRSDLILLASDSAAALSALALTVAINVMTCRAEDRTSAPVLYISLRASAERIALRLLAARSGISEERLLRGDVADSEFSDIVAPVQWQIGKHACLIEDTPGLSLDRLCARARRLQRMHDLSMVVVDDIQSVAPPGNKDKSKEIDAGEVARALKRLALELNRPVLALSLLRPGSESPQPREHLFNTRHAEPVERPADVVLLLSVDQSPDAPAAREEAGGDEAPPHLQMMERQAQLVVVEQRHGPTGECKLLFRPELWTFVDDEDGGPTGRTALFQAVHENVAGRKDGGNATMRNETSLAFDRLAQEAIEACVNSYCEQAIGHGAQTRCRHTMQCAAGTADGEIFTGASQPYIGKRYALRRDGRPFRLAIYSMDAGAADALTSRCRRMAILRDWAGAFDDPNMIHPRGTLLSVQTALGLKPVDTIAPVDVGGEEASPLDCFAMLNFPLCGRPQGPERNTSSVTGTMRTNCLDHVPALFHALAPTHVLVQGGKTRTGLDKTILSGVTATDGADVYVHDGVRYAYLKHPSARGLGRYASIADQGWHQAATTISRLVADRK